MRAFKVFLNGKRLCLAGIGEHGVLSTTITHVPIRKKGETRLCVGGLIMPQNEHVAWRGATLRSGDEVRLRIVEADTVDQPSKRFPRDLAAENEAKKRWARMIAKKFGWKIQEGRKSRRAKRPVT